jgi:hypothetical protein
MSPANPRIHAFSFSCYRLFCRDTSRGRLSYRDASLLRPSYRCTCILIVAPPLSMSLMNVQMLSAESNAVLLVSTESSSVLLLLVRMTFVFATLGSSKGKQPLLLVPRHSFHQLQHTLNVNRVRVFTQDPLWFHRFLPGICIAARYFKPPISMFTSVTLFCWD